MPASRKHTFRNMCRDCGGPTKQSWERRCSPCYTKARSRQPLTGPTKNLPTPTYKKQQTTLTVKPRQQTDRTCRRCPTHIQPPFHYCFKCYTNLTDLERENERLSWPSNRKLSGA